MELTPNHRSSSTSHEPLMAHAEIYACLATMTLLVEQNANGAISPPLFQRQLSKLVEDLRTATEKVRGPSETVDEYLCRRGLISSFPKLAQYLKNHNQQGVELQRLLNEDASVFRTNSSSSPIEPNVQQPASEQARLGLAMSASRVTATLITIMDAVRLESIATPQLLLPYLDDAARGITNLGSPKLQPRYRTLRDQINHWRVRLEEYPPNEPLPQKDLALIRREADRWLAVFQGELESALIRTTLDAQPSL